MITNFFVDQVKSFPNGLMFLACEPKADRATGEQARTKDGHFKWEVHVMTGQRNQFGQLNFDPIKIGITSETSTINPCDDVPPMSPVELVNFELGVMERTKNGEIVGVQVWYRCSQVRSTAATGAKAA